MKIIVCGGRDYDDYNTVSRVLWELHDQYKFTTVVQGGARGADMLGKRWAFENKFPCLEFAADWKKHGNAAGPIRNQEMLDESEAEIVVAFPGGRGTFDMIKRAKHKGVILHVVD